MGTKRKLLLFISCISFILLFVLFPEIYVSAENNQDNQDNQEEPIIIRDIITEREEEEKKEKEILKFPIFMYHTSCEEDPVLVNPDKVVYPELYVKPSEFEKQIKYLTDNNYTFCTFDDWRDLYDIKKPVFITFDDGYLENYTEIFPILKKYNAKITIFLVTNPKKDIKLTPKMIREMSGSGLVKFESHTLEHINLADISSDIEKLAGELRYSKLTIEKMTGRRVYAIAYPYGKFNEEVINKAKKFYQFGVTTVWGTHNTSISNYEIRRMSIDRSTTIDDFIRLLNNAGSKN